MAGTAETTTTYDDFLKYKYAPSVIQCTPQFSALLSQLETRTAKIPAGGKSITEGVYYNSMGSAATLAESDSLVLSLPGNFDNTVIPIYWHYMSMLVSGQAIGMSADKDAAMARAWAQEGLIKHRSFRQNINRQMAGNGDAILCQCDGAVSSQTQTIDNAAGISGMNDSDVNGAKFLTGNMYVQARNSSGTVHGAAIKISSISTRGAFPSTSAVLTGVGTMSAWEDGDYLYVSSGTGVVDSYGHEMPGVRLLIDDDTIATTVQSIDASANPEWNSQIGYGATPGTAEALTTLRLLTLRSKIQNNGGGKVDFIATSPPVWLTYGNLADQINQVMNAKTYDTAWPALSFMGVPIFEDPYMTDEMYFIDKRALCMVEAGQQGFIDTGGGGVISQRMGASVAYDEFQATWRWYMSLCILNRAWCGKLVDITVDGEYVLQ